MPLVEGYSHNEVPLEIPKIEPGEYVAEFHNAPTIEPNKAGDGNNICIQLRIVSDGPFKGQTIRDWISQKGPYWKTRLKQVITSAGLTPNESEQFDTADLYQREVRIVTKLTPDRQDPTLMRANVSAYLS